MAITAIQSRPTAVDACEQVLLGHVLSGAVAAGEHLPAERLLAEQLGVDRGTLRPAIARLVSRGLLVQRQGRGTIVQDVADSGGLDLLEPVIESAVAAGDTGAVVDIARDLLRLRRHLATALLERVVEAWADGVVVADADLATIEARIADLDVAWQQHEGHVDTRVADLVEKDFAVLTAVVRAVSSATRSLVFSLALNPVRRALAACPPLQRGIAADLGSSVVGWSVVVAFLRAPSTTLLEGIVAGLAARDTVTLSRLRAAGAPDTAVREETVR